MAAKGRSLPLAKVGSRTMSGNRGRSQKGGELPFSICVAAGASAPEADLRLVSKEIRVHRGIYQDDLASPACQHPYPRANALRKCGTEDQSGDFDIAFAEPGCFGLRLAQRLVSNPLSRTGWQSHGKP